MTAKSQPSTTDTAKIVLLTGIIITALAMLAFFVYRLSSHSIRPPTGEIQQMKASARNRPPMPSDRGSSAHSVHP